MNLPNEHRSIDQWVDYIQTLHHREIELSLERIRSVYQRMRPNGLNFKVITIAGTNGKGSTTELLASIYRAAGYNAAKFTSPHLCDFNERFNVNGQAVSDQALLDAFAVVESHRGDTPITFFEYGTLLAIELFASAQVDVAVMEVGLGGRLDSVNVLEPDMAIVTSISIDHTSWLGNTIEQIAYEKVGIARADKPLVIGLAQAPASMLDYANSIGAEISQLERDFDFVQSKEGDNWDWRGEGQSYKNLPLPFGQAGVQLANCALALQAVALLKGDLPVTEQQLHKGIANAEIEGRCQVVAESPMIVLDVSHNQTSVARLRDFVVDKLNCRNDADQEGRIVAVCGMLADKDIANSLKEISEYIDSWHVATIHNERGANCRDLAGQITSISSSEVNTYSHVVDAFETAHSKLAENDTLVVFGSFHIVGDILSHLRTN